ncbi:MAG: TRAM domain-containing protein [Desulfomonile tiedjei]|nr:TRAM domain-containing protein [Desulfomonile tiedjei]
MPDMLLSAALVLAFITFGGCLGYYWSIDIWGIPVGSAIGLVSALALLRLLRLWLRADADKVTGGVLGLFVGAVLGMMLGSTTAHLFWRPEVTSVAYCFIVLVFSLVGVQLGSVKFAELKKEARAETDANIGVLGILDTSVIIDGRIADVCETGFLSGDLVIPEFVLKELQAIADSSESIKRTRGRRGLDILNKMQKQSYIKIIIDATDYPGVKEVDQKLISMAKQTGYAILTNDFNLNKVAEVHSIRVLNVNQLANSLKPVVLPGETIRVQVIKEGKESGQGVAYLDDGTMVVVDAGRYHMGRTVEVTVTSVLQTTAGRMIFSVMKG